jgi:hypothetical protein
VPESAQKEVVIVVRSGLRRRHTSGKRREKGLYDSLHGKGIKVRSVVLVTKPRGDVAINGGIEDGEIFTESS